MNEDRIDVAGLREALGWTQLRLADFCGTDRSTVSKWEREPPAKGPALVLLRQLRDQLEAGEILPDTGSPQGDAPPASPADAGEAFSREAAE